VGLGQAAVVREMAELLPVETVVSTLRDLAGIKRVVRIALA